MKHADRHHVQARQEVDRCARGTFIFIAPTLVCADRLHASGTDKH